VEADHSRFCEEIYRARGPIFSESADSEIPASGLDMKTSATRIHALAKIISVEKRALSVTTSV